MTKLVEVRWGTSDTPLPDWRKHSEEQSPDDDEELAETSADVVEMLGFDPKELSAAK
jgi:hypothetical protein